ncbi:MAG: hypothetical protein QF521_13640, partial [Alphaproteobacteria bacterium]|nr:hypothetical protein [Alphaproteobacteria bacterium]
MLKIISEFGPYIGFFFILIATIYWIRTVSEIEGHIFGKIMFRPFRLRDKYLSMAARKFKRRAYLFGLIAVLIFFHARDIGGVSRKSRCLEISSLTHLLHGFKR